MLCTYRDVLNTVSNLHLQVDSSDKVSAGSKNRRSLDGGAAEIGHKIERPVSPRTHWEVEHLGGDGIR